MQLMVTIRAAAAGALVVLPLALPAQQDRVLPPVKYTEYRLPNGLRVILHEDKSTPIVAVNLWYHVGSKNEEPGRTGFAHLFEHMMFQGFAGYDDDYFKPLQEAGGTLNGSTNPDRTNYWQVVPSNFLELALFMEGGRMKGLLEAMTEEKLANQRDVVKNEKRQNYDNRPYGLVSARIAEIMYPKDHPYHWLTIGSLEDLTNASMDDVKGFFRRYYTPNNASLSIAGDFDPAKARQWVQKYFGDIPAGKPVEKLNPAQPVLTREIRDTMLDRVSLARQYMAWHGVPTYHADEAPLDAAASILGGGKSSRLYKILVYERQIAQDVSVANPSSELAGRFMVVATARPGASQAEIEKIIGEEIARLQNEPPTAEEVARFYNEIEANRIYSLQTVGGFGGKSDQLNAYAIMRGTPGWFEQDLARYRKVTPADVQRVTRKYLSNPKLVLTVLPAPRTPTTSMAAPAVRPVVGSAAGASNVTASSGGDIALEVAPDTGKRAALPKPGPDPVFRLPQPKRAKLSNGLDVVIVEHSEMPVVAMQLIVRGGASADPMARAGVASLTADAIDEGTTTRDALALAREFDAIGARLSTSADWDNNSLAMLTTTRQLDRALSLFSDVLVNPSFPESDVSRLRSQRLTALAQRRDDANTIASNVFNRLLYGERHPYGHSSFGEQSSLEKITRADLVDFYRRYYRPNNSTLVVVGDISAEALVPRLERSLGSWARGDVAKIDVSAPAQRDSAILYLVDKPGAAQSVITIGSVGVPRSTADYYPLLVMNTILGGQFSSRVNLNLRENKGYTYGARTGFDYRLGAGPFSASAGVQTAVTKESIVEFLKELRGIRGDIPVTQQELEFAKQSIIRGFPRTFETPQQIAGRLVALELYGLPANYYNDYIQRVSAVTLSDVQRVARQYLDPSRMAFLVVGDRTVIEKGLRELELVGGTLRVLDAEGNPVTRVP
jgi:zinc protease